MREEDRKTNEALKFSYTVSQHSNNINKSILMDIIIAIPWLTAFTCIKSQKSKEIVINRGHYRHIQIGNFEQASDYIY